MTWRRIKAPIPHDLNDPDLLWAAIDAEDDTVLDRTDGGVHLTGSPITINPTLLGPGISGDSAKKSSPATFSGLNGTDTPFTLECWFRGDSTLAAGSYEVFKTGSERSIFFDNSPSAQFFYWPGVARYAVVDGDFLDNHFHHFVATYDGAAMCLYIDGVLRDTTLISDTQLFGNSSVILFDDPDDLGTILAPAIYHGAKDEDWVRCRWNRIASRAVRYQQLSAGIETGSYSAGEWVPGAPIYVEAGSLTVTTDTINGREAYVVISTGTTYLRIYPDGDLNGCLGPDEELPYGEWEFWHWAYRNSLICFSGSGSNGPRLDLNNSGDFGMELSGVGGTLNTTAAGTNPLEEWAHIRFRSELKIDTTDQIRMTLWVNGEQVEMASGSNPTPWYTQAVVPAYLRFYLSRDNRLALASEDGHITFLKRPFWEVGE